jgi:hypothetical protein
MKVTRSLRGIKELFAEIGDFLQPMVALVMREYWKWR